MNQRKNAWGRVDVDDFGVEKWNVMRPEETKAKEDRVSKKHRIREGMQKFRIKSVVSLLANHPLAVSTRGGDNRERR